MRLTLLLAACASGPTDAQAYAHALSTAGDYASARASCDEVDEAGLRGDCQVTITERFERLDPTVCDTVEGELWQDECRFLMAERIGATGDLETALATCVSSRFRRHCAWHLLQDAVEDRLSAPHAEAETELFAFMEVQALPDAPNQFWRIRWRELAGRGQRLDERGCAGLRSEPGCRDALARHVFDMLQVVSRSDRARTCATEPGLRVLYDGHASWALGPVTRAAEQRWAAEHCPASADSSESRAEDPSPPAPTEDPP